MLKSPESTTGFLAPCSFLFPSLSRASLASLSPLILLAFANFPASPYASPSFFLAASASSSSLAFYIGDLYSGSFLPLVGFSASQSSLSSFVGSGVSAAFSSASSDDSSPDDSSSSSFSSSPSLASSPSFPSSS